ncbi:MAG: peptidoglycan-binding protein [Burkholderiales bacterium]|nr:peptidoglycan-binding protein [Burkholderiales bacterium]
MAVACGIPRIDALFAGQGAAPISQGDADREAVGVLQDFLACQGFTGMPGLLSSQRGLFGPITRQSVAAFQGARGIPATGSVDSPTLLSLVQTPAPSPVIAQGYVTLVLDVLYEGMTRLVGLTSQFEGAGRFGAANLNKDKCGLSFGLIQWSQKPGRLTEILEAFRDAERERFVEIFGNADAGLADALVAHTQRQRGGTNNIGETTDTRFDLVRSPWKERFQRAARDRALQKVQLATARSDFAASLAKLRAYCPEAATERGAAFMLDAANQHGDAGARAIYTAVTAGQPQRSPAQVLLAVEEESVRRVMAQYGAGSNEERSTQRRRSDFRTSALLSDSPLPI